MADLIYAAICSLDGYIEDASGSFEWAEPAPDVFAFINDSERHIGTYLFGRRMYEIMTVWETLDKEPGQDDLVVDFAHIWQAADKIVYSTSLESVSTARTRIERSFDPDAVRELKRTLDHDIAISGPDLASHAFRTGLVDEVHIFLLPIIVGGGKPALPADVRLELTLTEERRFGDGTTFLRYRKRT